MRLPMAANAANAGHRVFAVDTADASCRAAAAVSGIEVAPSPAVAASRAPVVFTCLPSADAWQGVGGAHLGTRLFAVRQAASVSEDVGSVHRPDRIDGSASLRRFCKEPQIGVSWRPGSRPPHQPSRDAGRPHRSVVAEDGTRNGPGTHRSADRHHPVLHSDRRRSFALCQSTACAPPASTAIDSASRAESRLGATKRTPTSSARSLASRR